MAEVDAVVLRAITSVDNRVPTARPASARPCVITKAEPTLSSNSQRATRMRGRIADARSAPASVGASHVSVNALGDEKTLPTATAPSSGDQRRVATMPPIQPAIKEGADGRPERRLGRRRAGNHGETR